MRKVRIGNDINVRWEVKTDGQAVSLEGKALKLYVRSAYRKEEITTFTVEGCVVSFTYPASMQRMTGARAVILEDATEGAPRRTVCADQAFTLVAHSCEENDDDVEFENFMVSLQSNVLIGKPGMSAYEVWLSEGNTGTLADWYAYLQKPATDVAAKVTKAETARVEAEKKREDAENARAEAETARQDAENGRDTAEQERAGNEDTRKTAEQSRNTAELDRRTDENIRTENESARMTEENKRIAAERRRAATFSALSADVDAVVGKANTAIEETDAAEALRADAEAGRTKAEDKRETNEQKRKLGETERKSAEMQREEVEESRVAAENSRVTAEKQRYDAEQERRQHEDAREDSEGKRDTAERLRKQAETGRNNAEQERTASEQTRMENETQRETNERKREEAEDKREEAIVKFENDFNEKLDLKTDLEQFNNTVSGINTNIATKANAQDVTNAIGELQDKIGDRVVVSGNVTNNPDEEDITTEGDTPQTQVLKLKDRAYDSLNASGKGYKILRKNWQPINGERKNVLTQAMINEPNTIYEIRYDFDLNGAEIQIKEGCTLNFVGGSLSNGIIDGNNTQVSAKREKCFSQSVVLKNTWEAFTAYSEWFDIVDDCVINDSGKYISGTDNYQGFTNLFKFSKIQVKKGLYYIHGELYMKSNQNVDFGGSIIKYIYTNKYSCLLNLGNGGDNYKLVSDIEVSNGTIYGASPDVDDVSEYSHGIYMGYAKNVVVSNINSFYNRGDGIYIGGSPTSNGESHINENISIINVKCKFNHRQGCSITEVDKLVISDSEFSETKGAAPQAGIDIEPNPVKVNGSTVRYQTCTNINIKNCIFNNNNGSALSIASFSTFEDKDSVNGVVLENCLLEGNIDIWGGYNIFIRDTKIYTKEYGVIFEKGYFYNILFENVIIEGTNTETTKNGFLITPTEQPNKQKKLTFNNVTIKGFGNYGLQLPDKEGLVIIEDVTYNNISISNCYHSFFSGKNATNVTYNNINVYDTGYKPNGEKYDGWTFGWVKEKRDDIKTRRDLDVFNLSCSSDSVKADEIGNNKLVIYDTVIPGNPVFRTKYNGEMFELGIILKKNKGVTSERPIYNANNAGCFYYDTTLKKYIVWNGTEWTNMDGTSLGE